MSYTKNAFGDKEQRELEQVLEELDQKRCVLHVE